ncbi:MAG: alpha/beta hydrolase [Litorimonas sp.]
MTTLRYKMFETLLKVTRADRVIAKTMDGAPNRIAKLPGKLKNRAEKIEISGETVWIIHPKSGPGGAAYIHFHGGAYILGLMSLHFGLAAQLSDRAGVSVVLPDYPLAPNAEVEEITDFANQVYDYAADRWNAVKIGGGSAGGNLAMALALYRKGKGLSQPDHILLMSPWVDLEMSHPANDGPSDEVCFSDATDLRRAAKLYAGDIAVEDPRVSPTFADLSGLAPISIFTGDVDLLHTDILIFAEKAKAVGVLSKLAIFGTMGHIFMLYPTPDRESALVEMSDILAA